MRRAALMLAQLLCFPLWWWLTLAKRARRKRTPSRPRVLLVAYNELTARYVGQYGKRLARQPQVELFAARAPLVDRAQADGQVLRHLDGKRISWLAALFQWWDLILVADHYPAYFFHPRIPKLFVTHGLFAGRRFDDRQNYVYGWRCRDWKGRPRYARMLAAGLLEYQSALQVAPDLHHVVKIGGDPFGDEVRLRNANRGAIREKLGLLPSQKTVLVMSSWGPDSLIQARGASLIEEANGLRDRYRFMLTIHPNNYYRRAQQPGRWLALVDQCRRNGWIVADPAQAWIDYVVSADLFITDYTSLGLYASLLNRPIVMTHFDRDAFLPGSPLLRLAEMAAQRDQHASLSACLRAAEAQFDPLAARRFASALVAARPSICTLLRAANCPC